MKQLKMLSELHVVQCTKIKKIKVGLAVIVIALSITFNM